MKNILIIYPGFPHYRNGILDKLINSKKNNYIFAADKNGYNNLKPFNFKDYKNFYHFPSILINRFLFHKGLVRFVLSQNIDGAIVHATPYWPSIILASIILRFKKVPVYNWTHGVLRNNINIKNKFYYYFFKHIFDGLLLYGNNSKNNLVKLGYDENKLKVIYNSLDYEKQILLRDTITVKERKTIRAKYFKQPDLYQLIFIGRLTNLKKLDLLIEVLKLLKDEDISVNLLFVGDGEEKQSLEDLIQKYGLKNHVHFFGASYDEPTNYKLIYSSDCCIAPGEIGLTAMHALMYGVPVISHNDSNKQMPEYEAIVPGKNGALFEHGNLNDLKDKIKDVFQMIENNPSLKNDCYEIMDELYNPNYQIEVLDNLFD